MKKLYFCISDSATSTDWHQGNVLPHQWHASVSARERPHLQTWGVSERTIQTAGGGERDLSMCVWHTLKEKVTRGFLQQCHDRRTISGSPTQPFNGQFLKEPYNNI